MLENAFDGGINQLRIRHLVNIKSADARIGIAKLLQLAGVLRIGRIGDEHAVEPRQCFGRVLRVTNNGLVRTLDARLGNGRPCVRPRNTAEHRWQQDKQRDERPAHPAPP